VHTTIKTGLLAAAIGLTAIPMAAFAEEESSNPLPGSVTGNIAIVNDYVFRGISQTTENAAVQGGLDYDSGVGIYLGTWLSSLNFNDGNNATTEVDLYGGYRGAIDAFTYDVGFLYYWYPGATNAAGYDFWEIYAKAGYNFGPAALTVGAAWSPDNTGAANDDSEAYFNSVLSIPVVDLLTVSGGIGYQYIEGAGNDYIDWNVGATVKVYDWFDIDARYIDTDVAGGCGGICDSRFVVKISRAF